MLKSVVASINTAFVISLYISVFHSPTLSPFPVLLFILSSSSHLSGHAVAAGGFGRGKGPVHLDQVRCTGKEDFLGECPSLGWGRDGCRWRQDAGVSCDHAPRATEGRARPSELTCGVRKIVEEGNERKSGVGGGGENILG